MNHSWLLFTTSLGTLLLFVAGYVLLQRMRREARLVARVQISRGVAPIALGTRHEQSQRGWPRVVAALGQVILRTGLLSTNTRAGLRVTLASAGLRGRNGLEMFIGTKIGLFIILPVLAMLALRGVALPALLTTAIPAAAAMFGLLLPDIIVRYRRKKYVQRVQRGLPDALDLLVICSQAGLGLSVAVARVADEMQSGGQDIGQELALTASDMELLTDNRLALQNLGSRTGIEGLVRLGTTLIQSMQYGTPLTEAMRGLSAEMRNDTLTRFEARAARMGVMLTLPMVVFILPCVFLVVGGPAAVQILHIGG